MKDFYFKAFSFQLFFESHKENWKNSIDLNKIRDYILFESHKENWKFLLDQKKLFFGFHWISQRELKVYLAYFSSQNFLRESHKENWKKIKGLKIFVVVYDANLTKRIERFKVDWGADWVLEGISQRELKVHYPYILHKLTKRRISQRELKEWVSSIRVDSSFIKESHKENWKWMCPYASHLRYAFESHKENWKIVHPPIFIWNNTLRNLTKRIERSKCIPASATTSEESHKENWKERECSVCSGCSAVRISQRELKAFLSVSKVNSCIVWISQRELKGKFFCKNNYCVVIEV